MDVDIFTDAMKAPLSEEEKTKWQEKAANYTQKAAKPLFFHLIRHPNIVLGTLLLLFICAIALLGPLFSPYSYSETRLSLKNTPPSKEHILGTDDLGRDIFTRSCYGIRISLAIGFLAACIDVIIGVTWGAISGYIGGRVDQYMMKLAEMIYSLPYLLFAILVTAVIGPGFIPIIAAMIIIGWIQMARITRNQVMKVKRTEFVLSAIALGMHPIKIIFRHILPNISGPLIASAMLSIPYAIFAEAFLSFLGIGIQPPMASLGSMVSDAVAALRFHPWRLFSPACLISSAIFAFNLLGDGLRDLLDPQHRNYLEQASASVL